jgi:hypothetical protein
MAARNGDDTDYNRTETDTEQERYTNIWLDSGELVIYDVDNADAWIQSGSTVALDAMA